MAELTPRIRKRIAHDFPASSAERVLSYLEALPESAYDGQGHERVQAAVVLASAGQWDRFQSILRLLILDWRDVLMAGGLGEDDWRTVMDAELGVSGDLKPTWLRQIRTFAGSDVAHSYSARQRSATTAVLGSASAQRACDSERVEGCGD